MLFGPTARLHESTVLLSGALDGSLVLYPFAVLTMRRALTLVVLLAVLSPVVLLVFFGRRYSADRADATLLLVRGEGMARIGYADQVPLAYGDATRGLTGEAPEIARAILARMGVSRVEGVPTKSGMLVSELYQRRYEIVASGLLITQRRCQRVSFSDPTHVIGEGFLVRSRNPLNLHSYADVAKTPNAHIGVVSGSEQHTYAISAGIPASRVRVLTSPGAGVATLLSGGIDAFATDALMVQRLVDQSSGSAVERALTFEGPKIGGQEVKHYAAFAFRKDDVALAREFNRHLSEFLGTPEHIALVRKFGITEADLPPKGLTAESLCQAETAHSAAWASQ